MRFEFDTIGLGKDREIMMQAVKNDGANLQYASLELQGDKELVLEAVRNRKKSSSPFEYASPLLRSDKEFVMEIMDIDVNSFLYISDRLRADEDVALKAVSLGVYLEYVDFSLTQNKEFVRKAININVDCIRTSESYRNPRWESDIPKGYIAIDKELATDIVNRKGELLYFLSGWKSDPDVIAVAIKNNPESIRYVPESIRKTIISILKK